MCAHAERARLDPTRHRPSPLDIVMVSPYSGRDARTLNTEQRPAPTMCSDVHMSTRVVDIVDGQPIQQQPLQPTAQTYCLLVIQRHQCVGPVRGPALCSVKTSSVRASKRPAVRGESVAVRGQAGRQVSWALKAACLLTCRRAHACQRACLQCPEEHQAYSLLSLHPS